MDEVVDVLVVAVVAGLEENPNTGFDGVVSVALAGLGTEAIPNFGAGLVDSEPDKVNDFAREAPSLVEDAGGVPGGGVAFARSSSKAFWAAEYPAFAFAKKSALKLI